MRLVDKRLVHRLFYPSVPAILCSSKENKVSAMPVVSYLAISEEPAMVGVACSKDSFTFELANGSGFFSLCLLDKRYIKEVEYLGKHSGREINDKISLAGLHKTKAREIDSFVIEESSAVVECKKENTIPLGDHILLIGNVLCCYAVEDFRDYWSFKTYKPILYSGMKEGKFTVFK